MQPTIEFKISALVLTWFWLIFFAVLPFVMILIVSFMTTFHPLLDHVTFTTQHYKHLINAAYFAVFEKSAFVAGITTGCCLLLGYPFAYFIARMEGSIKNYCILFVIIPFWTSSLIRSYALIAILKAKGLLNTLLLSLGLIHQPLSILFTNTAVLLGLVYNLLPFMILPIMTNIERLDYQLVEAAHDLGANGWTTLTRIIIPLTLPGIMAGCILVFLPAMTIFYIPDILGGAKSMLLGNLIQNQFLVSHNWPMGTAVSTVLTVILIALLGCYWHFSKQNKKRAWL